MDIVEHILEWVGVQTIQIIDATGYAGISFLMTLEGSFIPVPSEIILPFSGYLVSLGRFSLLAVAFWGAVGNILGTVFTYTVSRYVGISFLYKYGKFFLVTHKDIEEANQLFKKHGAKIIFISRLIPGIRGFVPIPAGIAKMKFIPFVIYVFTGSFLYSLFLTYLGVLAGENWTMLEPYFRQFDWVLILILVTGATWWIRRYIKGLKAS
ncbi:MAG: DedA family protein [Candidatus Spechtbacterales bacterium]|nr:DedA family protein [Candidatus Spechtbacterales bacterium]